jgi:hypothetical protein
MDEDIEACEEPGEMLTAVKTKEQCLRKRPLRLPAGRPVTDHHHAYATQARSRPE